MSRRSWKNVHSLLK